MSDPFVEEQTFASAGTGEAFLTKGGSTFSVFVEVEGGSTTDSDPFEFRLEASPDANNWAEIDYRAPDADGVYTVTEADLEATNSGTATAYVSSNSFAVEYLRPTVETMQSKFSARVHIFVSGLGPRSVRFNQDV